MVMEAARHGTVLSLRSVDDLGLVREVLETCATHGVRHKTFLREALRLALGAPHVLEAAKRADVARVVERRAAYRDRMRWYRGRGLI
jgi:hypothetical protein